MCKKVALFAVLVLFCESVFASHEPWTVTEFPQDREKRWWDDAWWENGTLAEPRNFEVITEEITYTHGDVEIPAYIFRPRAAGRFYPVLFQHGRRGLDDLTVLAPKRLAARGFIVLAPDIWSGRLLDSYPLKHNPDIDLDVARGIDALLALPDVQGEKACVVSHTRGGYMTLRALVTHRRQERQVSCYVSYYPHWQNPDAPEPAQVYRYAPEIDALEVPVLIFFGEHEQYQRLRPIMTGMKTLQEKGRSAQLIVYPGVGRGFDFRPPHVRTFADDLATKDSLQRAARFIRRHLSSSLGGGLPVE